MIGWMKWHNLSIFAELYLGLTVLSIRYSWQLTLIIVVLRKSSTLKRWVWFVPAHQVSHSATVWNKAVNMAASEQQICKLDLFAWQNWLIGGLHGWVWWEQPRRIIHLWWPAFFFLYKKELQGSQIFYMHIMYVQRPSVSWDLFKICRKKIYIFRNATVQIFPSIQTSIWNIIMMIQW